MNLDLSRLERKVLIRAPAILPRPMRVRARYHALERWHMKMARRADVFLVRHPKGGGTWLRALITHLYAEKYGLSSRRLVREDELYRQLDTLPRFLLTSGYLSWERSFGENVARDPELRDKKLLFLARDPSDVVVSWYRQFTKRTSAFKREMMLSEMEHPIDRETIGMWDFILHPEIGLPAVIEYHNVWQRNAEQMKNALVVRYEDLRADGAPVLKRIADFLGDDFGDEGIRSALEFGSMENMRALERSDYFDNRSMRLRNPDDPDTLKVRRGKVGGYRDDLSQEQAEEMARMVRERISPALGYGS